MTGRLRSSSICSVAEWARREVAYTSIDIPCRKPEKGNLKAFEAAFCMAFLRFQQRQAVVGTRPPGPHEVQGKPTISAETEEAIPPGYSLSGGIA